MLDALRWGEAKDQTTLLVVEPVALRLPLDALDAMAGRARTPAPR